MKHKQLNHNGYMFPLLKIKYSSLPFQGQFGFKKESDDDDGKSTGTSN